MLANPMQTSESKFVTSVAERIVKPLIAGFCSKSTNKKSCEKEDILKCPFCDKTSTSSPGMKCHITKMHQGKEDPKDKSKEDQKMIKVLMGDEVAPRKDFITNNALDVVNLDI